MGALFGDRDGPQDYTAVRTDGIDDAFGSVDAATDPESLAAAWRRVQRSVRAAAPVAWIYHARGVQGVNRRIAGATPDLRGELATIATWRVEARAR